MIYIQGIQVHIRYFSHKNLYFPTGSYILTYRKNRLYFIESNHRKYLCGSKTSFAIITMQKAYKSSFRQFSAGIC